MSQGLLDRVDCARLAEETVFLERSYTLSELPRLKDLLADARGSVRAGFAFAKVAGRTGATVSVQTAPQLVCQRCLQGFTYPVAVASEIEFASDSGSAGNAQRDPAGSEREIYTTDEGWVSLRELAEEELLLALPIVAACSTPQTCGRAPAYERGEEPLGISEDRSRPFAALQDLLKKT